MRKLRLNKWDVAGVSLIVILFAAIVSFRAYIEGRLFPRACTYNDYHLGAHVEKYMPRVWISDAKSPDGHYPDEIGGRTSFLPAAWSSCQIYLEHDWENFYFYCPASTQNQGLCP